MYLPGITFVPFFPSRIFQISNSLLTKRSTKTDSRERVLSREGSLNFSHKEREERERALESDFYRAEQKERFD